MAATHIVAAPQQALLSASLLVASLVSGHLVKRNDDVGVSSLAALVQQQASMIQTLQADLAAERTRVTALEENLHQQANRIASLENKHPDPVAFTVHFSAAGSEADGVPVSVHSTLIFDAAVTNIGRGYDPNTGVFTAPSAGIYAFFLSQMAPNSHTYLWLDIVKEGSTLDVAFSEGSGDNYDQGSSQVTTHLAAGERVWVRNHHGDAVRGSWWTVFTGYLVQAD